MLNNQFQDQILKSYIEQVFQKYDKDRSNSLDQQQMTLFFNDLFQSLKMQIKISEQQALQAIKSIDSNYNGTVSKQQLFRAFKIMLLSGSQQQPQPIVTQTQAPLQVQYGGVYPSGYNANYQYPGYMQPQQVGYNYGIQQPNYLHGSYPVNGMGYNQPQMGAQNIYPNGYNYMAQSNNNYMAQSNPNYMVQSNPNYMAQSTSYMNMSGQIPQNPYGNGAMYNPYNKK